VEQQFGHAEPRHGLIALSPSGTSQDKGTCNGQVSQDVLRAN
jgi:hypothetical protein